MTRRVVVLGAGVVGTACAHYLRDAGCEVTLIDRGRLGGGCSHANCGFICPSHVLPHAGPGAINMILRTLLQRNSPLAVRPRLDWSLFSWMWRFATRCDRSSMLRAARAIQALLDASRRMYDELFAREPLTDDWQTQGLLFVFHSRAAFDHYAEVDHLLRSELALPATPYAGPALTELEPALKPEVAGAWHYACDAQVRPDRLLTGWKRSLLARGVDLREGHAFTGFVRSAGRPVAARTDQGDIPADEFVVALGAWTPLLARELRCPVPIQPGKGYSVTMPRPGLCPRYPLIFEEHRVAVSPFATGYRIGSTMELNGFDDRFDPRRIELLIDSARLYLREPVTSPVEEQWWGWRPMVPDGVPIIGPVPAQPNVWMATGHGMLGLSMATGTGRLVAELVTRTSPHVDPAPYAVTRF